MKTDSSTMAVRSPWTIVLLVMLVFGIFFRLVNLEGKVFWVDEAFTAFRVSGYTEAEVLQAWAEEPLTTVGELAQYQFPSTERSVVGTVRGLATAEPQLPPLYFVLTRWWVMLFGDSVAVMRSFGAIASLATLPLLALLCQALFPARITAYIAVCLMAVSPFQIIYAQEARPYSLWTLLTVAACWALLRAIRQNRWNDWVLYGVILALSFYTFLYTLFVAIAHGIFMVWHRRSQLSAFALSLGGALLAFAPWMVAIALHWQQGLQLASWQRQPAPQGFLALPVAWVLHLTRTFLDFDQPYGFGLDRLFPYGLVVLVVLVGVGYALALGRKTAPTETWHFLLLLLLVPALGVILPDLLTGGQQSTVSRYFVPCWVALLLLVAHALSEAIAARLGRLALAGLLTLSILSCGTSALDSTWWNKEGGYIPFVANSINQTENPLVVTVSDWWLFSLAHDLRPETPFLILTNITEAPNIPGGYRHHFLYSAPPTLQEALTQQGIQLATFKQLDRVPVWCMALPGDSLTVCPPAPPSTAP
ncbi:MAG: glycosyltransferase family 39 protein [Cyanobacteria bacterium J06638_22]